MPKERIRDGSGVRVRWDSAARACLYGANLDFGAGDGELIETRTKASYGVSRTRETTSTEQSASSRAHVGLRVGEPRTWKRSDWLAGPADLPFQGADVRVAILV